MWPVSSGPFLIYHSFLLDILIPFKFSTDCVTRAPSPMGPAERLTFLRECLLEIRAKSVDCINHAISTSMDFALLPAFHLTLAFLPFKVLRAASLIDPRESGPMAATREVQQYRSMLISSHSLGASMIGHIEDHQPSQSWFAFAAEMPGNEGREVDAGDFDAFAEKFWEMCEGADGFDFTEFSM